MTRCVVVGAGAREHALAWALSQSFDVVVAPGNDGMAAHGLRCVSDPPEEIAAELYVIGPEAPLVDGLADRLRARGALVFGPGADGAQLEGSKAYLKEFLAEYNVPTADFAICRDEARAAAFLARQRPPYVVKTDGLAAGKGVLVTSSLDAALADVHDKLSGAAFGAAGSTVIVEEGLPGVECSLMVLCDGTRARALVGAQDFKRALDGDRGANTGGMGAFAPFALMNDELRERVLDEMIEPTLRGLRVRGIDYRGVLYAGLMVTDESVQLLEYNVRFGDPETEVLAPLYGAELGPLLEAAARGALPERVADVSGAAVTVVLASRGYPESSRAGDLITGLAPDGQLATPVEGVTLYHAGTKRRPDGTFETAGGRVLAVTAVATTLADARARAYRAAETVTFSGQVWRRDIAAVAAEGAP